MPSPFLGKGGWDFAVRTPKAFSGLGEGGFDLVKRAKADEVVVQYFPYFFTNSVLCVKLHFIRNLFNNNLISHV